MPFDDSTPAAGRDAPPDDDRDGGDDGEDRKESLIVEIRSAADAAVAQARKVAATASTEARISIASVIWMFSAMMLSVALLISAWSCVVGIGIWFAVDAGWSVAAALLAAAIANVVAAALCRFWFIRLSRNIGFARTLSLLLGPMRERREHSS